MGRRGNHEGTISKRADGRYMARITLDDGRRKAFYGATRHEAATKLAEALRAQRRGMPVALDARTRLDAYLDDWLARIAPTVRASTHRRYSELLYHTRATLGKLPLVKLTSADLDRLYARLQQQPQQTGRLGAHASPLSASTVHRVHSVLHKALADAVREGLLDRNVAELARAPRDRDYEPQLLTLAQSRIFLQATRHDRLGPLYLLAALTGMRLGELCGLRWSDVALDTDNPALYVRVALSRTGQLAELKTKASRRQIALPALAVAALRLQRKHQVEERLRLGPAWTESDLIFTSTVGTPLDGINTLKAFRRFMAAHHLPAMRLHDLRHLQASLLLAGGINPKVVQERLGHSKSGITMDTYAHLMPTLQREAADVLDALLGVWDAETDADDETGGKQ